MISNSQWYMGLRKTTLLDQLRKVTIRYDIAIANHCVGAAIDFPFQPRRSLGLPGGSAAKVLEARSR